jgi:putative ABC transport system ATP-binding protein
MSDMKPTALVNIVDVHKHFGPSHVLRGITMEVNRGEWVALMGPSGCGKSTLLNLVAGLDNATSGHVNVDGQDLDGLSASQRAVFRRSHIGIVFQAFNLIPHLDVQSNIEVPLRLTGSTRKEARRRSDQLTSELGLADFRRAAPSTLSGGQQQRVALGRALAAKPAILLADEPTGSLDSEATEAVLDLLRAEHRAGQAMLMVTHDYRVASVADRIIRLFDGICLDSHDTRGEANRSDYAVGFDNGSGDPFDVDTPDLAFQRLVNFE